MMREHKLYKSEIDIPAVGKFVTIKFSPIKKGRLLTDIEDIVHGIVVSTEHEKVNENAVRLYSITINHLINLNGYLNDSSDFVSTEITIPMSNRSTLTSIRPSVPSRG